MKNVMLVFPGQGSQYVGMVHDLFLKYDSAKVDFKLADEIIGERLSDIIFNGPESELQKTFNAQPAIMLASAVILNILKQNSNLFDNVKYVSGHSLGEYTALYASGAISFEDAMLILRKRGQYMSDACEFGSGMLAVLGGEIDIIEDIVLLCRKDGEVLSIANINCPGQVIISGHLSAIDRFKSIATDKGLKKMIQLPVSGAFHSPLMKSAQEKLQNDIDSLNMKTPVCDVVQNYTALPEVNVESIKKNLIAQVTGRVRWSESIEYAIENGVDTIIEIGPKSVLTGMIKRIDANIKTLNIETVENIEHFLQNGQ